VQTASSIRYAGRHRGAVHGLVGIYALCLVACDRLLGTDEYELAPPIPSAVDNPCKDDEVLTESGACAPVGVRPEMCDRASRFEPDPNGGCRVLLPAQECPTGLYGPAPQCAAQDDICQAGFPSAAVSPGVAYVDGDATEEGDGSLARPFNTLSKALEFAPGEELNLSVKGTFNEDVAIARSYVTIRSCKGHAKIVGQRALQHPPGALQPPGSPSGRCFPSSFERYGKFRGAALCIAPGTQDVRLHGLDITGPGEGVSVFGARGVFLSKVHIHHTGHFGMRLMDSPSGTGDVNVGTDVELDRVTIYQVHGAGIQVIGSTLLMENSSIQHTRGLNNWAEDERRENSPEQSKIPEHARLGWARGLSIHPGLWPNSMTRRTPSDFPQSNVTVRKSVITGNREIAVYVAGATAKLEHVFLGATEQGERSGRGIVAERSLPVAADTAVILQGSVIERTSDAAIDVRDASVTVRTTTIRDTRGREGDLCSGQAIRARTFPTGDGARASVEVTDTSVLSARQAGILAASSTLSLARVLIRDVRPEGKEGACAAAMGDGIALEGFSGQTPTRAVLNAVRVHDTERAGILTTGGPVDYTNVLVGCSGREVVDATGRSAPEAIAGAVCGCGKNWARCKRTAAAIPSWFHAGPSPIWPNAGENFERCFTDFNGHAPIARMACADLLRPEIAPVATGQNGCALFSTGPRNEIASMFHWKPGFEAADSAVPVLAYGAQALGYSTTYGAAFGVPLFLIQRLPVSSRLIGQPEGIVVDIQGRPLIDGRVPEGSVLGPLSGSIVFVGLFEPGWHTFEVSELPAGFACKANPSVLGSETRSNLRFARVEWGITTQVEFRDCGPVSP
jgi:hypothetical protein